MGTTPKPLFDMSKAVPLTPSEHPLFDMSKAVPMEMGGFADALVSKDNGGFADALVRKTNNPTSEQKLSRTLQNMTYAMSGQSDQMHPDDKAEFDRGVKAGTTAGIVTAATGALSGAAAPLTAPRAIGTTAVGTGILDATGREIMRDVTTYGPSVARQVLSHPLTQSLLARTAGYAGAGYILKTLGILGNKP